MLQRKRSLRPVQVPSRVPRLRAAPNSLQQGSWGKSICLQARGIAAPHDPRICASCLSRLLSFARLPRNWRCCEKLWASDLVTVQGRSVPVQSQGGPSRAKGGAQSPAMSVAAMAVAAMVFATPRLAATSLVPSSTSRGASTEKTLRNVKKTETKFRN